MKLVVAIVHDDDAYPVIESLTEANFSITKLASTGGFYLYLISACPLLFLQVIISP